MEFDRLSNQVIGCALEVHRNLGPGLLESAYEQCLAYEFSHSSIPFKSQWPLPVKYKSIELKSVDKIMGIHKAQLLTYMKLSEVKVGLLINFNVEILKTGIKRFVL